MEVMSVRRGRERRPVLSCNLTPPLVTSCRPGHTGGSGHGGDTELPNTTTATTCTFAGTSDHHARRQQRTLTGHTMWSTILRSPSTATYIAGSTVRARTSILIVPASQVSTVWTTPHGIVLNI